MGLKSALKASNVLRNIEIDFEKQRWSFKVPTTEIYKMGPLLLENMKLVFLEVSGLTPKVTFVRKCIILYKFLLTYQPWHST